jgi:hypothetical protein
MPLTLPMPGSPGSSWAAYRARLKAVFDGADARVCAAFFLFGMQFCKRSALNACVSWHNRSHQTIAPIPQYSQHKGSRVRTAEVATELCSHLV